MSGLSYRRPRLGNAALSFALTLVAILAFASPAGAKQTTTIESLCDQERPQKGCRPLFGRPEMRQR